MSYSGSLSLVDALSRVDVAVEPASGDLIATVGVDQLRITPKRIDDTFHAQPCWYVIAHVSGRESGFRATLTRIICEIATIRRKIALRQRETLSFQMTPEEQRWLARA